MCAYIIAVTCNHYTLVPNPISILVESIDTQPLFLPSGNVTNATLRCTVQIDSAVDVRIKIQTNWTGPDGFSFANIAMNVANNTMYTSTANVGPLKLKHAGVYHCISTVMPDPENRFITNTGTNMNETTLALCKYRQKINLMH